MCCLSWLSALFGQLGWHSSNASPQPRSQELQVRCLIISSCILLTNRNRTRSLLAPIMNTEHLNPCRSFLQYISHEAALVPSKRLNLRSDNHCTNPWDSAATTWRYCQTRQDWFCQSVCDYSLNPSIVFKTSEDHRALNRLSGPRIKVCKNCVCDWWAPVVALATLQRSGSWTGRGCHPEIHPEIQPEFSLGGEV